MGARLLSALGLALALLSACAGAEKIGPRHPGDPCFDVCPQGMACTGTVDAGPRHCELEPDRCIIEADCHKGQAHCIGASGPDIGFCAYGLPF